MLVLPDKYVFLYTRSYKTSHRIYTMEYYIAANNDKTMQFSVTWMKVEEIVLNKINQNNKNKHGISLYMVFRISELGNAVV